MALKKELTSFDLTSIIVGSIVGADIYIASAFTAGLLGPAAILVWIVAGICATIIALVFAYCSYYVPRVGGLLRMSLKHSMISTGFSPAGASGLQKYSQYQCLRLRSFNISNTL
jgi:L-asparagine transporter-like permease